MGNPCSAQVGGAPPPPCSDPPNTQCLLLRSFAPSLSSRAQNPTGRFFSGRFFFLLKQESYLGVDLGTHHFSGTPDGHPWDPRRAAASGARHRLITGIAMCLGGFAETPTAQEEKRPGLPCPHFDGGSHEPFIITLTKRKTEELRQGHAPSPPASARCSVVAASGLGSHASSERSRSGVVATRRRRRGAAPSSPRACRQNAAAAASPPASARRGTRPASTSRSTHLRVSQGIIWRHRVS